MKLKFRGFLVLLVLITQTTFAQERFVSGVVSDNAGMPLPGVSVLVKGTKSGTQTDFDGKYAIKASSNQILIFSFIGMKTQEVMASSSKVNIKLENTAVELEGVVVTALGIKREKKALGYAVSEIKTKDLEQRPDSDIARVLNGKASGVNIIAQSGLSGSGTNVVIRGYTSFSGSNQALFIVDGVPFSSDTNSSGRQGERNDFVNGNNGSSRFLDLDPNNIESVNVLKGLAAATLYGTAGRNGVILITTKSGSTKKSSKKSEIAVATSLFINEVASLPKYQNKYGGGFDQAFAWAFSNWGPTFEKEGAAGWGNSPQFDANGTVAHPYSTSNIASDFPELAGARYEYKPYNSVKNFFRKGVISNLSVNMKGSSDDGNTSYNLNYGHNDDQGFTPGNNVIRNTLSLGGRAKLSNKFTVSGTLNYAKTDFTSPPVALSQGDGATGTGSSIFGDLWYTPRSVNLQGLPYQRSNGSSAYYRQDNSIQNPYWTLNNSGSTQSTNRVFGNFAINYDLNSNLSILYRAGLDNYNEANSNFQNRGGVRSAGFGGGARYESGFYETWNNTNTIWDHSVILNGKYELSQKINFNFNAGGTTRNEVNSRNGIASDDQVIFDVLRHYNFKNSLPIEGYADRNIVGLFAQTEFDYENYLFLTLAGRKDWVSDFAPKNRSQFYPSTSLAFIPTTAFKNISSEKGLNFLKLRAGIGTSANFGDFGTYPVSQLLSLDVRDNRTGAQNIVTNAVGQTLANPNLKPELLTEYEVGLETKFFKNRFGIDLSLFKRTTTNLIVDRPLDPASGYGQIKTNIGKINGEGIELDLTAAIVKNDGNGFTWDVNINFTSNDTEVISLGLDTERVIYSGFSNLGNVAEVGQPLTSIFGSRIERDANGQFVINAEGNYLTNPVDGIIGDANPDWIMNIGNTFTYKNFNLNFLINYTKGGDIYSSTVTTLLGRGLLEETLDRERTFILPGVNQQGQVNTVQINNSDLYFSNVFGSVSELQIYDASTIRLQELSLGYTLPSKYLDKTAFSSVSFNLSGNNLYFRAINMPKSANFDPNTSGTGVGNGIGFDFLNGPSARRYGFSVKVAF